VCSRSRNPSSKRFPEESTKAPFVRPEEFPRPIGKQLGASFRKYTSVTGLDPAAPLTYTHGPDDVDLGPNIVWPISMSGLAVYPGNLALRCEGRSSRRARKGILRAIGLRRASLLPAA